jgi:alanine-glyoxylate transaminase/serine-glyoxylate transaminase/serine-pyruvate transaminase
MSVLVSEQIEVVKAKKTFKPFEVPNRLLFSPGPTPVPESVLQAMTKTVLGHLDPRFLQCMDEIKEMLKQVFETENRVTLPVSGTGSGGMEAAIFNAVEPGDDVVVCPMGVFGERMLAIIERTPANPVVVRAEWGEQVDVNQIEDALKSCKPRALALVHAETSTGVAQNLEGLAELAHKYNALLIVDAVASLAGQAVSVDENQIDICYSGSQKCIGAPPGLAPITFSERAVERLRNRNTPVQSWYFDISMVEKYWGGERTYHHTAPISTNYALHEALRLICEEGLEARWARHELAHRALVAGLEAMGIALLTAPENRAIVVNAVRVPEGVDGASVRTRLLNEHNIEIAGGLGSLKGKIWRIGLMGESSQRGNVLRLFEALHQALNDEGFACPTGVETAEKVFSQN